MRLSRYVTSLHPYTLLTSNICLGNESNLAGCTYYVYPYISTSDLPFLIQLQGMEADDLIATYTKIALEQGHKVLHRFLLHKDI